MSIKICAIAAMAQNRVIGRDNGMPWHIPADFKHFKETTMGKPMIMGRKTFESLPGILPGRTHIVVSRRGFEAEGVISATSIESAIEKAKEIATRDSQNEIMIVGGAQIYMQSLPLLDRLYLSLIHKDVDGDAYFPKLNENEWPEITRTDYETTDKTPAWSAVTLEKI